MGTTIAINGTNIYHEVRGAGPPLLFVTGASGDAGTWQLVAEPLADTFTVITYDRRANSRSPRPAGWTATSVPEQADDAAALLRALDLGPAIVYGNSSGAMFTCELVIRHPGSVQRAFVHEPPLLPVVPNGDDVAAELGRVIDEAMAAGGPRAVMERFLSALAGVPLDDLPTDLRERLLGNAGVFLDVELPGQSPYVPDPASLGATGVPVQPISGVENRESYLHHAARWLADGLGVELLEIDGGHVPQYTHPAAVVDVLRPHSRVGMAEGEGRIGSSG
ncbi:MAG: alpha/beta hydrolase [Pseudonocardia sp.]|nr:alpha/beta hydrolase [Pseudonocardia sp.]